jgi:hypothetical protein
LILHVPRRKTMGLDDLISGGASWLKDAIDGPLKALVENPFGELILRAIATSLTGGLAPILGPQLATIAWAIPGVVKGEPVDRAWFEEFSRRVDEVARLFGAELGKKMVAEMNEALSHLKSEAESLARSLSSDGATRLRLTGMTSVRGAGLP